MNLTEVPMNFIDDIRMSLGCLFLTSVSRSVVSLFGHVFVIAPYLFQSTHFTGPCIFVLLSFPHIIPRRAHTPAFPPLLPFSPDPAFTTSPL